MDDNAPKENPPADFNKLDLSQLQGFSFGTQWTQEKPAASDRGERSRPDDRREGSGGFADRRDRRSFRRPAGPGGGEGPGALAGGAGEPAGPGRREFGGERRPRQGGGEFRGGPRREGGAAPGGERGPRYGQGGPGFGGRGGPQDRGPYESPYYTATFYPEDTSFNTLVQTIRKSCRTVELFEIARTVVAKNDRFVVVAAHRPPMAAPGAAAPEDPAAASKQPRLLFHVSVPDGLPFDSDEAAVAHVLGRHLDRFFDMAEVEVDPPKGNFQVINRCSVTGELLGPPNYHRYNQIVQQHYAAKIGNRMPLEVFRSRIETVRDPEVVNQWLAKMKKTTRYTWKLGVPAGPAPRAPEIPAEAAPAPEEAASTDAAPAAEESPAPVAPSVPTFDTLEDARLYLLSQARDKVVRTTETARFHGKLLETMPPGEIKYAVEGALERQRRFPLDTANALRGRLRREHFTIFKKGSKGVSYVCAVKRKFRVPGQTFADSIGALIGFIEANPMVRASELASKFLGIANVAAPKPAPVAEPAPVVPPAEAAPVGELPPPVPVEPAVAKPEVGLTIEERAKISRLQGDLVWLVREGYVTEFIDGRLFAPPPMVEARKKEIESEEHDPENFPEAPPAAAAPAPASEPAANDDVATAPAAAAESETAPLPPAGEPVATSPEPAPSVPEKGSAAPEATAPAAEPVASTTGASIEPAPEAPAPATETKTVEPPPPATAS